MKQTVNPAELWAQARSRAIPRLALHGRSGRDRCRGAAILQARGRVFICGGGVIASGAMDVLEKVVTLLNAPVCTTVSGKGSIVRTHPLCAGVVG